MRADHNPRMEQVLGPEGLPENSMRAAGVMEEGERAVNSRGCERGWTFPLRARSTSWLMISCSG